MEPTFPYPGEPEKPGVVGPPPPDIMNPLDRLARRPRVQHHIPPHMPFPHPHLSAAHDAAMSLNFAPPSRGKLSPSNRSPVRETNEACLMSEQENVVVTDGPKAEGAVSDGEAPPPPPPKDPEHSEEGECDSDPEEGELGDGEGKRKEFRDRNHDSRHKKERKHSPRDNIIPLVKKHSGALAQQLDPVQRKLERIANKHGPPYREPSYRDKGFRERGAERGPERDEREAKRSNGSEGRSQPRDFRGPEKVNRPPPEFRREGKSMRPGDMPSLISLPPMPVISSSSKGKVPDFPPLSFSPSPGVLPPGPVPPPIPHPVIPPPVVPPPGAAWAPPPGPLPPSLTGRPTERGRGPREDDKFNDDKIKESFDMYHKAWESYYSDIGKDKERPKERVSRERTFPADRRSRSPGEGRERFPAPPHPPAHHPGIPAPFPGMMPMVPGVPGMPPHMMPGPRSKESAWERGLKVSKKIREEVKRNEKSEDESDDSQPGTKLASKIVMKDNKLKSRSPSLPKGKLSTRRLSPLSDGGGSSHANNANPVPPRLTPERYRGAYERKAPSEDPKKPKPSNPAGDADWHDPWMRPNSPKDRKRQLSRSSSSSDTSSEDSSPHNRRLQELKRHIDAHKRRKAKKDAVKLKRLKEKLSPSEFELLTSKKSSRKALNLLAKSKHESNSDSDSDDSSSNSSSVGSASPGIHAGKLADSPTSPLSSPEFNYKDKKRTKEILMQQLQRVEKQLEKKKKDDTKRRHS